MTLPILTIRAEAASHATVAAGAAMGLSIEAAPLAEIRSVAWSIPGGAFDGLLIGSTNALLYGGPLVDKLGDKPVYAVGKTTAATARQRGFRVARVGEGGLQALLDSLAGRSLALLRLAGREHVQLIMPLGISIATAIAYESVPLPLSEQTAERLKGGALVLLHSATAAHHFAAECDRLAVHRGDIPLAALSSRIAEAAGAGWAALRSAAEPNEAALLALACQMCHDPPAR